MASRRVERRRAAQAEHLAEIQHDEVAEGLLESSDGIAIPEADLRNIGGNAEVTAKRFQAFVGDPAARGRPDALREIGPGIDPSGGRLEEIPDEEEPAQSRPLPRDPEEELADLARMDMQVYQARIARLRG